MKTEGKIQNKNIILTIDTESEFVHVSSIEYFNQQSFLDVSSMYTFKPNDEQDSGAIEVVVSENEINNFSDIINQGCNYKMDANNDLIVVQIRLDYDANYIVDKCCKDVPCCITMAFYDKCPIYTRIVNSIDDAMNECVELAETDFINNILNKKMIDSCIDAKQFAKACKLWGKFYSTGKSQYRKGGCNCHG